jgi:hypothetical protein
MQKTKEVHDRPFITADGGGEGSDWSVHPIVLLHEYSTLL